MVNEATTVRSNIQIEQSEYPQLHEDLLNRKPRSRAKRIEQLAHLGLLFEKQLHSGQSELAPIRDLSSQAATAPVAKPAAVKTPRRKNENSPTPLPEEDVLVPPAEFGDDMASLFDGGITL